MIINNEHKLFRAVYRLLKSEISYNYVHCTQLRLTMLAYHIIHAPPEARSRDLPVALPLSHGPPASCYIPSNFVQRRSLKMFLPIGGQDSDLGFPIDPKNTRVVEDLDFLLPIDFRSAASEEIFRENQNMKSSRRKDDRRITRDHNGAIEPSAQVH